MGYTSRTSYGKNTVFIIQYLKGKSIGPVFLLQSYLHQGSQPYMTVIILKGDVRLRHDALEQDSRKRRCNIHEYGITLFDSRALLPVNLI